MGRVSVAASGLPELKETSRTWGCSNIEVTGWELSKKDLCRESYARTIIVSYCGVDELKSQTQTGANMGSRW